MSLNSCRPIGEGVGFIPWTAINEYAKRHDIEDFNMFCEVMQHLDGIVVEFTNAKVSRARSK